MSLSFTQLGRQFELTVAQMASLQPLLIDLGSVAERARTDADRVRLFLLAEKEWLGLRLLRLALCLTQGDLSTAEKYAQEVRQFMLESADLAEAWAKAAAQAPKKLSLSHLWKRFDPFRDVRERTRAFAVQWELAIELREALG